MNERPKIKLYKRGWFLFFTGVIVATTLILGTLSLFYWDQIIGIGTPISDVMPLAYFELREKNSAGDFISTDLDSRRIEDVVVVSNGTRPRPTIAILLDKKGKQLLADITSRNIGKEIAVYVNGDVYDRVYVSSKSKDEDDLLLDTKKLSDKELGALVLGLGNGKGLTKTQNQ